MRLQARAHSAAQLTPRRNGSDDDAVQPFGKEHHAIDNRVGGGHVGVIRLLVYADVAGFVRGEGKRFLQVRAVHGHVVEHDVLLRGGVDLALGHRAVEEHGAEAKEVLDVGHAECGLGRDIGGCEVVRNVEGVHEIDRFDFVILKFGLQLAPSLRKRGLKGRARGRAGAGGEEGEEVAADALLHVLKHALRGHVHGLVIAALDDGLGTGSLAPFLERDFAVGHRLGLVLGEGDGVALGNGAALQRAGGLVGLERGAGLLRYLAGYAESLHELLHALREHEGKVNFAHAREVGFGDEISFSCHCYLLSD